MSLRINERGRSGVRAWRSGLTRAAAAGLCGLIALALALPAPVDASPGLGDTSAAPRCEVDAELMAVVYNEDDPDRSFAMLIGGKRTDGWMVSTTSYVAGRPVMAVLPEALWLGPVDSLCWMPLAHEGHQRVRAPKKRRHKKKRKRKRRRKR